MTTNNMIKHIIDKDSIIPLPIEYQKVGNSNNVLQKGKVYILQGESCEGIEMPVTKYECIHVLPNYKGIALNTVVMKQIDGEEERIFSLTRTDCRELGIEYQPKLQLFPMNFNWISDVSANIKPFDPNNMGTYPVSPTTGLIERIKLCINGFKREDDFIITPTSTKVPKSRFKFEIASKKHNFNIILNYVYTFDRVKNNIEIILFFKEPGVNPQDLEGETINDIIDIFWLEPDWSADYQNNWNNMRWSSSVLNFHFIQSDAKRLEKIFKRYKSLKDFR